MGAHYRHTTPEMAARIAQRSSSGSGWWGRSLRWALRPTRTAQRLECSSGYGPRFLANLRQMALRAEGEDALCLVELRGFEPLTPCMPCSFSALRRARSEPRAQPNGPLLVTVADRQIPLVTAAYGTLVARPARTMAVPPGGFRHQLGHRVGPVLGGRLPRWQVTRRRGSRHDFFRVRDNRLVERPALLISYGLSSGLMVDRY
jgi:hypothetical protein